MIVAWVAAVAVTAWSGWLTTLDPFHTVEWVEELHAAFADLLLFQVVVHVGGVIPASLRHGENLVRALISGRKRAAQATDIA
jgi:cytochrome b